MPMSFGFVITAKGAAVIADRVPLHEPCTTPVEVERQIAALKADLDRVAKAMTIAVAKRRPAPPQPAGARG